MGTASLNAGYFNNARIIVSLPEPAFPIKAIMVYFSDIYFSPNKHFN